MSSSTSTPSRLAAAKKSSEQARPRAGVVVALANLLANLFRNPLVRRLAGLRPAHVGLLAAGIALAFVALRLIVAADGDITRFVVAGDTFVARSAAPGDPDPPHAFPGNGYDGQFYWRLAVDPAAWDVASHDGVAFDGAYRAPRVGYPLVAWLASAGRPALVAWTLVGVNVAAVGVVASGGSLIATRAGRSPVWGLAVAAAPGLVLALGRDLAEPVTVACLVGGIAALQHGRWGVATVAWSYAVLTREQALLTVGAYAAWRLCAYAVDRRPGPAGRAPAPSAARSGPPSEPRADRLPAHPGESTSIGGTDARAESEARPAVAPPGQPAATTQPPTEPGADRSPGGWVAAPPGRGDLPWLVPAAGFLVWQAIVWQSTGRLPLAAAGGANLVPPFSDMLPGLLGWARGELGRIHAAAPLQLAGTVALVVAAARAARTVPRRDRFPVVALAVATVAGTCLAASIWRDPSDMRHLVDVSVLSWVVLLLARADTPRWAVAVTAGVWVATATVRILAI